VGLSEHVPNESKWVIWVKRMGERERSSTVISLAFTSSRFLSFWFCKCADLMWLGPQSLVQTNSWGSPTTPDWFKSTLGPTLPQNVCLIWLSWAVEKGIANVFFFPVSDCSWYFKIFHDRSSWCSQFLYRWPDLNPCESSISCYPFAVTALGYTPGWYAGFISHLVSVTCIHFSFRP